MQKFSAGLGIRYRIEKTRRASLATLMVLASFIALSTSALAAERKILVREPVDSAESWRGEPTQYGLGLAAMSGLTTTSTALAGTIQFTREDLIEGLFGIGGTKGGLQFGLGALYKHTLTESAGVGFHVGGGLGIANIARADQAGVTAAAAAFGTTVPDGGGTQLSFALAAVAGLHLSLPQLPRLKLSFDAGPTLTLTDNNTNFSVLALSPALGLSVIYQL